MQQKKLRVGVLFGGKSAEHEISLQSARNVIEALDPAKYETVLIGIDKKGRWHLRDQSCYLIETKPTGRIELAQSNHSVAITPSGKSALQALKESSLPQDMHLDVVFPVLHGFLGEDGCMQGFLKLANIPFVGAGVLGSAINMDKDVAKRLLRDAGLPIACFEVLYSHDPRRLTFEELEQKLGLPFFIKPANTGSSVGISKVSTKEEYERGLTEAFRYDHKVVIEECIQGREIECSVLGNREPIASLPAEVISHHGFYSYVAKYEDSEGATLCVPADLPQEAVERIQKMAVRAYQVLCCEGMGRVDFFLKPTGELVINEINSIPGFTSISLYPRMWEASGLSYTKLLDQLIELAIERHAHESQLKVFS